jgi:hypothetical protein
MAAWRQYSRGACAKLDGCSIAHHQSGFLECIMRRAEQRRLWWIKNASSRTTTLDITNFAPSISRAYCRGWAVSRAA